MKAGDIAEALGGELRGDPGADITGVKGLEDAGDGDVSFVASKKQARVAASTGASCLLVEEFVEGLDKAQIKVKDPHMAFVEVLLMFHPPSLPKEGVDERAWVSPGASLGRGVSVGAFACVSDGATVAEGTAIYPGAFVGEGSRVGAHCVIHPGVVIMGGVSIGDRVVVHANSVIGADGFGYIQRGGRNVKVPQVGGVVIGDDVEIGASVTIDRATTGNTVVGSGTKIDNLVQIGHNVVIGENVILVAQVAIGGSARIGNNVMIGGQAGIADHAVIEDGTMLAAKSGVSGRLSRGVYSGVPVVPHREWLKASAMFSRLPELSRRLASLEEKILRTERGKGDD